MGSDVWGVENAGPDRLTWASCSVVRATKCPPTTNQSNIRLIKAFTIRKAEQLKEN